MRLSWLSSLPPANGPAAELTGRMLSLVAEGAEVVLLTEQESWDPALEEHATVTRARFAEPTWAELNRADMTVFSIDGEAASGPIWRLSQRHPGLVIVHDAPLWPLFVELARAEPADRERLAAHIEQAHGREVWGELVACVDGETSAEPLDERYPLTALAVHGALAALVGSRVSAERLTASACPVAEAALPSAGDDPGPWVDAFEDLIESARRFQPLSASQVLAREVTDELGHWSGFSTADDHGPRCVAGGPHPLRRRVVTPVADAVDELLRQTRAGGGRVRPAGPGREEGD